MVPAFARTIPRLNLFLGPQTIPRGVVHAGVDRSQDP